jgi:hypothetical protein
MGARYTPDDVSDHDGCQPARWPPALGRCGSPGRRPSARGAGRAGDRAAHVARAINLVEAPSRAASTPRGPTSCSPPRRRATSAASSRCRRSNGPKRWARPSVRWAAPGSVTSPGRHLLGGPRPRALRRAGHGEPRFQPAHRPRRWVPRPPAGAALEFHPHADVFTNPTAELPDIVLPSPAVRDRRATGRVRGQSGGALAHPAPPTVVAPQGGTGIPEARRVDQRRAPGLQDTDPHDRTAPRDKGRTRLAGTARPRGAACRRTNTGRPCRPQPIRGAPAESARRLRDRLPGVPGSVLTSWVAGATHPCSADAIGRGRA